jgi:hypothetical protein
MPTVISDQREYEIILVRKNIWYNGENRLLLLHIRDHFLAKRRQPSLYSFYLEGATVRKG